METNYEELDVLGFEEEVLETSTSIRSCGGFRGCSTGYACSATD